MIAPLAWLTMCIGQVGTAKQFGNYATSGHLKAGDFVPPLLFLAGAGLILGIIACLRISPVGPLVAGIAYLGSYVALLIAPKRTYDLFAYTFHLSFLDDQGHGDLTTPLTTGTAAVVGALLIVAAVSIKRWRRWPSTAAAGETPAFSNEPLAPVSPAPAPSDSTATLSGVPSQSSSPYTESEPVGTVVWTREPAESTTARLSGTDNDLPVAGGQPSRLGGSPWDTPPGETAGSSTR